MPGNSGPAVQSPIGVPPPANASPGACSRELSPVCGFVKGRPEGFSNACMAREAGAERVRPGPC
jgi:hypothetical protein